MLKAVIDRLGGAPGVVDLASCDPEGRRFVNEALGEGDCRVSLIRLPNVVGQYFNAPGQLIFNTLEITRLPAVVQAAPEDLEDSRERIGEVLAQLG